jgi:H+/Cl- antiporter ClcA
MEPYYSSAVANLRHIRCEWAFGTRRLPACILITHPLFQMAFSFISSHLVRSFAKYAAGSGISEIKCILAGFVMQGYLGFVTFFIKSITLVSSQNAYDLHMC